MIRKDPIPPSKSQRTDYFEFIPKWSNAGKCFEVLSDDISGRIPVTRLESWREFSGILESKFFNRPGVQLAYRGHRRYDWSLTPSLGRLKPSRIVSKELAARQLKLFQRAVRGRVDDRTLVNDDEEDELWSVGQHHELMTPLLDWTYSPYVALFFSFAKEDRAEEGLNHNRYRAIYVLNKTFIENEKVRKNIRVLEPRKDDHGRLVNQAGLFTFSPYESTIENELTNILAADDFEDGRLKQANESEQPNILAKYICKIYIKNENREDCLRHLRRMNVHHASLFPDLLGAAEYCNTLIAEEESQRTEKPKPAKELQRQSKPIAVEDEKFTIIPAAPESFADIRKILKRPSGANAVEPGRINLIADALEKELSKNMLVDWEGRDSIQAKMRNAARVILRKYGYPLNNRDEVVNPVRKAIARKQK